jgi:hypothetical protein
VTTPTEAPRLPERATWGRVIRDQRKVVAVGVFLMIFSLWFAQGGHWTFALCLSGGIFLGLVNHIATEHWLLKIITSGAQPTRGELTRSTIIRLAVLAVVAVGCAVAFWPDGIGLLLGLAIFRLISLVMTTIPLLKELKNQ